MLYFPCRIPGYRKTIVKTNKYRSYYRRAGFFAKIIEDVRLEMAKNKEIQESFKKLREEAQRLEHSDALQNARMIFHAVKSETIKRSEVFKAKLDSIKGKVSDVLIEVGDISQKAKLISNVYQSPVNLRRRVETIPDHKVPKPDTESLGIEVHAKIKYDESHNPVIKAYRALHEIMQLIYYGSDLSETFAEIRKVDPNFDISQFLKDCKRDVIPNILEAIIQGNLEILKDWCFQGVFDDLSTPIKQAQALKYQFCSKVLYINNVDLVMGKVEGEGPVLVVSFTSEQIVCFKDDKGNVVQGDPNKVIEIDYIWLLCRDLNELDPKAAWRLIGGTASFYFELLNKE